MLRVSLLLSICLISGCAVDAVTPPKATFADYYKKLSVVEAPRNESKADDRKLTISARDMKLTAFARFVANQTGLSVFCDSSLDSMLVTIEAVDAPLETIMSSVARRIGVSISRQGTCYYIGQIKPEDKSILVRKCRRMSAEDLQKAVATVLTESGKVVAYPDGLLVCGDTTKILQSVNNMIDGIEGAAANSWVIQLYLVSYSDDAQKTIGLESDLTAQFALNVAQSTNESSASAALSEVLHATKKISGMQLLAQPLLLVLDGQTASLQDGQKLPIPKKAVSNEGTVSTTDYEYVDVGIISTAVLREQTQTSASCKLTIQLTNVSGYVGDAPIVSGQTYNSTVQIEAGHTYLAGSMSRDEKTKVLSGTFFPTLFERQHKTGLVQVWLRAYRIDNSGVVDQPAEQGAIK